MMVAVSGKKRRRLMYKTSCDWHAGTLIVFAAPGGYCHNLVLATRPVKLVAVYPSPTRPLIESDLTECLSGEFSVLMAKDFNAKNINWNPQLITARGSLLRDCAKRNSCLIYGPDSLTTSRNVIVKHVVLTVPLTVCSSFSSNHLPILIVTTCRSSFQKLLDRPDITRMDWCAGNTVWVKGILFKLAFLNFPLNLEKTIKSYLDCRTFQTSFQSATSTCRGMRAVVAQGGLDSSVLFSLYVNDIPPPFRHVELAQCADDTALVTTSRSPSLLVSYLEAYLGKLERCLRDCHQRLAGRTPL
jgi:hypothetical protein